MRVVSLTGSVARVSTMRVWVVRSSLCAASLTGWYVAREALMLAACGPFIHGTVRMRVASLPEDSTRARWRGNATSSATVKIGSLVQDCDRVDPVRERLVDHFFTS